MAMIDGETSVAVTMRQMVGGIVALLFGGGAILWAVLTFTIGGVRDDIGGLRSDVSAIRGDLSKLQESAAAMPVKLSEAQLALSKDISGLRVDLESFRGDFKVVRVSLDDLGTKMDALVKQQPKR